MNHVGWDASDDYIVEVLDGVMRRRDDQRVDIDLWDPKLAHEKVAHPCPSNVASSSTS